MAKYEQYEEYKPTGVIWIPEMPQGWQVTKLKYLIKNLESGVSVNAADYPKSEGEFGVLKTSCVYTREFRAEENKTVFEEELSRVKCPVRAGSIIISRMNTPDLVGAAVYVKEDYSNLYLPDRLWQTVYNDEETQSSKYLHYFMYLKGFRDQISNFAEGASSSMQSIAKEDFLSINILLPTRVEQEGIANFLDHETAQIDTLIEKQQTLIQLLKEKRQAVISHAVTKGLNPDAPMKDSGVEWLGEVPEHWVRASIKNLCYVNDGNHGEEYPSEVDFVEKGEGVPFIRGGDFDDFRIVSNNLRYISHEKNKSMRKGRLQENDILFVNRGATIGKLCIIDKDYVGSNLNSQIAYLRADKTQIDFRYLTYFLSSSYTQTKIISSIYGGALPQYPIQNIINLDVWYGSVEEQSMIADYLDKQVKVITYLIGKAEQAIQLMQERRTALISAAVTGKIDVRGWRASE